MQAAAKNPFRFVDVGHRLLQAMRPARRSAFAWLFVLAIVTWCCLDAMHADSVPTITVHAVRYEFQPAAITLKRGQTVQLVFIADDVAHGISIPDLGVDVDLPKHKAEAIVVSPKLAGDFDGECSKYCGTGHNDMTFIVHVTP